MPNALNPRTLKIRTFKNLRVNMFNTITNTLSPHATHATLASLLPGDWFAGGNVFVLLLICAVSMAIVIKGADWLVMASATVATRIGISKIVVGATIVSLGTTTPETAVSVLAAWSGNAGLALGNGVGSIIADTGLIFGLGLLLMNLPADRFILNRQGWVQIGSAVMLSSLAYGLWMVQGSDAALPRIAGVAFLILLVAYIWISIHWSRQHVKYLEANTPELAEGEAADVHDVTELEADEHISDKPYWQLAILFIIGLCMVVIAGDALVQSVSEVAFQWGVPQTVIAGTIVALGTSLPELVVGITAIRKGHAELLIGNVIGADILNVLFVIGAAALAAPLPIVEGGNPIFLSLHLPTMLLMLVFMRLCIFNAVSKGHFSRWMGVPLLLGYFAYLALNLLFAK